MIIDTKRGGGFREEKNIKNEIRYPKGLAEGITSDIGYLEGFSIESGSDVSRLERP